MSAVCVSLMRLRPCIVAKWGFCDGGWCVLCMSPSVIMGVGSGGIGGMDALRGSITVLSAKCSVFLLFWMRLCSMSALCVCSCMKGVS